MFLPIRLICESRTRKDSKNPISIQYCFSSEKRTVLPTGIAIPKRYWNKRFMKVSSELPEAFGNAKDLNDSLKQKLRNVEDIVSYALKQGRPDPLEYLKQVYSPDFNSAFLPGTAGKTDPEIQNSQIDELDFFTQFDDYIESKSRSVSLGMLKSYKVIKKRMLEYQKFSKKKITFESFDYNFYQSFVHYLTYEHRHMKTIATVRGLKKNSVGTSIKQLRIFLRDRMRRKIIPNIDLYGYKILEEETDAIYLDGREIRAIYDLDLNANPEMKRCRDLFVLGCLTGLRFSDFSMIKPEDIRNGMLYKKQNKSNHWVVIPLRPEAQEILINRFKGIVPRIYNGDLNRNIKIIGQLARIDTPTKISHKKGNQDFKVIKPKYSWIATHTCRRSFCTNEFIAGTPPELIMKISGHKSVKDFYKYIRITPEAAGLQIREIWEKRGEMTSK